MLATLTSACCSLGMSAGHYLTTLAYQTAQTVVHPFRVCYDTFIRRYNALVSCCWMCWSCAYSLMSYPPVFYADLIKRLIKLMTKSAHICSLALNWWLRFAQTITTTLWRTTCYASSSFSYNRQLFSSWAHIFIDLPSCAGTILLAVCTQLKKEILQLLWYLTPYPCKTIYTWLWPGTRQHSSSPQVSAALVQPAGGPTFLISLFAWPSISLHHEPFLRQDSRSTISGCLYRPAIRLHGTLMQASSTSGASSTPSSTVVSPSDSGTEAVKAHHPSNDSIGAGAASSSSPRSTLAGGTVFAGEPMPISDTQFLAPRVCCSRP